ncbi:hypothetical protein M3Y98_00478800 [Aphelenchoides besseyi]|nr:hypothetical protein M3Y98_00478800 [Aphelenchoides besseyi]
MSANTDEFPCTSLYASESSVVGFRYSWKFKVTKRLISTNEWTILNVSPSFCTAFNGVQFTWCLRLCDEHVLPETRDEDYEMGQEPSRGFVTRPFLYLKDGPSDISLKAANISVEDVSGVWQFFELPLENLDYTKGSGWAPFSDDSTQRSRLSSSIQLNVGKLLKMTVELRMDLKWFQPFGYLPNIDKQIKTTCEEVLDQILSGELLVHDAELYDVEADRFDLHHHIYQFGCTQSAKRCSNLSVTKEEVENVFANVYFDRVIEPEAQCFEDFIEILIEFSNVHFAALRRECERLICREVLLDSADTEFVKKVLLLAERFGLKVLKMVAFGVIVDRFVGSNEDSRQDSVEDIRAELLQIADQIPSPKAKRPSSPEIVDEENEVLVGSVIGQLEQLAKHIRKVNGPGVGPCAASTSPALVRGRRSSLKTSRELLSFSSAYQGNNSPTERGRRRSIMFALPIDEPRKLSESPFSLSSSSSRGVLIEPDSPSLPEEHENEDTVIGSNSSLYADNPITKFTATSV